MCVVDARRRRMFSASRFCGSNRAYRHYKFAIRVKNGSTHRRSQERLSSSASCTPYARSSSLFWVSLHSLGDQFARWTSASHQGGRLDPHHKGYCTDDVFKSTVHRAANRSGARRYSIPLFFGTDYDVRLEVGPHVTFPYPVSLKDLLAYRELRKCRAAATL